MKTAVIQAMKRLFGKIHWHKWEKVQSGKCTMMIAGLFVPPTEVDGQYHIQQCAICQKKRAYVTDGIHSKDMDPEFIEFELSSTEHR